MAAACGVIALGLPGNQELLLLLVVGLLLFGRRLPEVGRAVGRTVTEFRKGLSTLKNEMDSDGSLRDARSAVDQVKRAIDAPRRFADPRRIFEQITDESRASAGPETTVVERPAGHSPIEQAAGDSVPHGADAEQDGTDRGPPA